MPKVAEFYGFRANRAGFVNCMFHSGDRDASLKIYSGKNGGFHCFGCGAHGSVIDFVMKLFDISFSEAVRRIDSDFSLGLHNQTYRDKKAYRADLMAKRRALIDNEQKRRRAESDYWLAFDMWRTADMMATWYSPARTGGKVFSGYAWAVKSLPQLSYELMLAEERRKELDNTSKYSGVEKR